MHLEGLKGLTLLSNQNVEYDTEIEGGDLTCNPYNGETWRQILTSNILALEGLTETGPGFEYTGVDLRRVQSLPTLCCIFTLIKERFSMKLRNYSSETSLNIIKSYSICWRSNCARISEIAYSCYHLLHYAISTFLFVLILWLNVPQKLKW